MKPRPRYWLWGGAATAAVIIAISFWQYWNLKPADQPSQSQEAVVEASVPPGENRETEAKMPRADTTPPAVKPSGAPTPRILILERRPSEGRTCAAVHFGAAKAVEKTIGTSDNFTSVSSFARNVCGVRVRVELTDGSSTAMGIVRIISGAFVGRSSSDETISIIGSIDRTFDIPALLNAPLVYEVEVKGDTGTVALLTHRISP
jgi:hypothetical protein